MKTYTTQDAKKNYEFSFIVAFALSLFCILNAYFYWGLAFQILAIILAILELRR